MLQPDATVFKAEEGTRALIVIIIITTGPALIGNDLYFHEKTIKWDPVKRKFIS